MSFLNAAVTSGSPAMCLILDVFMVELGKGVNGKSCCRGAVSVLKRLIASGNAASFFYDGLYEFSSAAGCRACFICSGML